MLAVTIGVALAVLFALLGVTQVLEGKIGLGLAAVTLVASALIYIFYSRGNNVEKSGYGALLFVIAIAFIIPLLLINQTSSQAAETSSRYDLTLHRGAALFGQYCASCHGYQAQGQSGPKLNNNDAVNKLSNDDLHRIISGGVPNPEDLTKYSMPPWLDTFGGPLTESDIDYLVQLIRSSDKDYRDTNQLGNVNGFNYVLGSLANATQIAQYNEQLKGGSKPNANTFADLTAQKTVSIDAQNVTSGAAPWGWVVTGVQAGDGTPTANVKIKAGTTLVFGNKSSAPHNVFSGPPGKPDGKFKSEGILSAASADTYKITLTTPGDYPYYCGIHPAMVGYITVVP